MGDLTESEIFSCMVDNFKLAAEHAEALARIPAKGPTYLKLRDELKLIEGACRQASAWRDDSRWLKIGMDMAEAHKRAGGWLRGIRGPQGGRRVAIPPGQLHPLFVKLAENLRGGAKLAEDMRTKATGRMGMILPDALPGPHRDTRPAGWNRTPTGIIVPSGVGVQ